MCVSAFFSAFFQTVFFKSLFAKCKILETHLKKIRSEMLVAYNYVC